MGDFIVYTVRGALLLTLLFAAYKISLGNSTEFSVRRISLLLIYLCAILVPLAEYFPASNSGNISHSFSPVSANIIVTAKATDIQSVTIENHSSLINIVALVMVAGMIANLLITLIGFLRIVKYRVGSRIWEHDGIKMAVTGNLSVNPFTFGNTIYLSEKDFYEYDPMIIAHELCHCKKRHYIDLIIARIVACLTWWNPFSWFMLRELHDVHEYQADRHVISNGFDMKCYQYMLIKKAAGSRLQTFADSLNHSKLKKRLTMMKRSKKKGGAIAAALMIPALIAGGLLMSNPTLASLLEPMRNADINFANPDEAQPDGKVSDFFEELQTVCIQNPDNAETPAVSGQAASEEMKVTDSPAQNDEPGIKADKKESDFKGKTGKPAFMIDGKLMPESFDMNSINPNDIESITVLKDNEEEYPNGLISIVLKKDSESNADAGNSDEPLKILGYGTKLKSDKETDAKFIPNVYIVNHVDNMKGTNFTLTIVPGSGEEVEIKGIQLRLNGKTYEADSVSSSFSRSNDESVQKVEIHLDKTFRKFDPNKDKIIVHTANATIELPIHII